MDLSKLSTEDLQALRTRDLSKMSSEGLASLREQTASEPVEEDTSVKGTIKRGVGNTLTALGKAAGSLRALTTGPATGYAIEKLTGKDVFSADDVANAVNPTNLKTFPTNAEMLSRAGVRNPQLSEVLPGYAEKGKGAHWYTPEKGGLLDPSLGGALEVVSDPAMWLGGGEVGAAAKTLAEASKTAKVTNALAMPARVAGNVTLARPIAKGIEMVPGLGPAASVITNPISQVTRLAGKSLYGSTMRPVEHQGELVGKKNVVEAMQKAGVVQPFGMENKTQRAADILMNARKKIYQETAAAGGGTMNMREALAPGYTEVDRLRSTGSKIDEGIADALQEELDYVVDSARGRAAIPPTLERRSTTSSLLDETGNPITKTEVVQVAPGVPAIPARPYSPERASSLKSSWTQGLPGSTYKPALSTPKAARGLRDAAGGVKEGIEGQVNKFHPTATGADVEDINQTIGSLIGTKPGQMRVSQKADRELDNVIRGTGMDAVVGGGVGGVTGDPLSILKALLIKKGIRTMQLGTMPTGYAVQKLGESNILDRLNELSQGGRNGQR
jgi:hypothetical protein